MRGEPRASLRRRLIPVDIVLRDLMKLARQFDAHDLYKRQLGRHEQDPHLARAYVHEDETIWQQGNGIEVFSDEQGGDRMVGVDLGRASVPNALKIQYLFYRHVD